MTRKAVPTQAMKAYGGVEVQPTHSSPWHWMQVCSEPHAPVALSPTPIKQETGLASEPVWAFWRGDNFNNNNNNYYYYYYYYNNSVLQCTLQCYVLQSRSTALQCYVLQSRSTALQCYVLQSRSTALQTPITVAISEVADPSGRAVCGYGYIGAKTDTTQQSGQTPDKEAEIKKKLYVLPTQGIYMFCMDHKTKIY